jgi:hypothetical protein
VPIGVHTIKLAAKSSASRCCQCSRPRRGRAEAAGEVGATAIDAVVMASAAQRGDVVYTSDFDDLNHFRRVFPTVTVLRC